MQRARSVIVSYNDDNDQHFFWRPAAAMFIAICAPRACTIFPSQRRAVSHLRREEFSFCSFYRYYVPTGLKGKFGNE
jgi:hypothetical protein